MTSRRFFSSLAFLTALAAALNMLFSRLEQTQGTIGFGWWSMGFFVLLTLLIYGFGRKAAGSGDPNALIQLTIGITGAKLFLSAILIVLYFKLAQPPSKWFLVPFFSLYLIYTIFETIVLMRLSRANS